MATEKKLYTFGSAEEIVKKCLVGYREGSDILRVYEEFAAHNAGQQRNVMGVNIQWELAVRTVKNYPGSVPMLHGIMNSLFEEVMTALLEDDPTFLAELLEFRAIVLDEANKS